MYLYSNDGFTSLTVGPDIVAGEGQILFDNEATEAEINAVFPNHEKLKQEMQNANQGQGF